MRHPIAANYLARVIHMTGPGSLARAVDEGRLEIRNVEPQDELTLAPIRALAKEDRVIGDEARALAATKKWPTDLAGQPYGYTHLRGETARGALPRILRILERDCFELESAVRECQDDDEVCSLLQATHDERRTARQALANLSPRDTLPGAK